MIFKQHQQVLDGPKVQTRRLVKEGDYVWRYPFRSPGRDGVLERKIEMVIAANRRLRWQVGKTYAVQPGRGKHSLGRIRITEIRRERLQDISVEDVEAEGVCVVDGMPLVLAPSLRSDEALDKLALMVAHRLFSELWDSINTKKGTRWADSPDVWVLVFELVEKYNVL
jgi:hypothetical protein